MEAKKIETLRREFQDSTAPPQGACPDTERIWDAAAGDLPVEQRREVVSHLCSCAECTHAWRLAWAMQAEMREEAVGNASHSGQETVVTGPWAQWKPYLPKVAAAAMLILALGVGVMWNQPEPVDRTPAVRGATVEHEIESLIPEGEALPREDFVLRWSSGPQDATYRIRVLDEEMNELTQAANLQAATFQVPREALENIPARGNVYWYVETYEGSARVNEASFVTPVK